MNPAVAAARDVSALIDEQWPDGTYGGPRPDPSPNAAAHRQTLADALEGWTCGTTTELRDRATPAQLTTEKGKP